MREALALLPEMTRRKKGVRLKNGLYWGRLQVVWLKWK